MKLSSAKSFSLEESQICRLGMGKTAQVLPGIKTVGRKKIDNLVSFFELLHTLFIFFYFIDNSIVFCEINVVDRNGELIVTITTLHKTMSTIRENVWYRCQVSRGASHRKLQ